MSQQGEVLKEKVITPEGILSYPTLFEARTIGDDGDEKYSTAIIFTKGNDEVADADLTEMKEVALRVAQSRWPNAVEMIRSGKLRWPFREKAEDIAEKGYDEVNGVCFVNANTKQAPQVVGAYIDPATSKLVVIDDEARVYAGVVARLSLTAYTYDVKGNKGVTFGLNNVQIIRDGTRIDGRTSASADFDALAEAPSLADFEEGEAPAESEAAPAAAGGADPLADLMA